eukprot:346790-Rhodomonas_salina.1
MSDGGDTVPVHPDVGSRSCTLMWRGHTIVSGLAGRYRLDSHLRTLSHSLACIFASVTCGLVHLHRKHSSKRPILWKAQMAWWAE